MHTITRRAALAGFASIPTIGAVPPAAPATARELIRHHFLALPPLFEREFGIPFQVIAVCGNPDLMPHAVSIYRGKLRDAYGILGGAA